MRLVTIMRRNVTSLAVLALLTGTPSAVAAGPPAAARAATPPTATSSPVNGYRLVDLGTLGGSSSFATAMNDRGAVVGRSQTADGIYHGFLWRHGRMTDLGDLSPQDINNRAQIVGTRPEPEGGEIAYLWSSGTLTRLSTPEHAMTSAVDINDRGQIVGLTASTGPDTPVVWSGGRMRMLPLNSVSGINDRGAVAGGRITGPGFHATLWRRCRSTDLGAAAFDRSNSVGINNRGWVIGWTFSERQDIRGALWRRGIRTDVGTLGGDSTQLLAINDRGHLLGTSALPDNHEHPVLWRRGVLTDLSTLGVDADTSLADLNDRGEIAGAIRPVFGIAHAVVYRPR
jgi:probable HAF family extracellular repeat protein